MKNIKSGDSMTFSIAMLIMAIFLPALSVASKVLFCMWIYKDAKMKNIKSFWWIIGTIFTSWIVLIIYIIYTKDRPIGMLCPTCNTYNFHDGEFCIACGEKVTRSNKKNSGLLLAGIITYVVAFIFSILAAILMIFIANFSIANGGDYYGHYYNEYCEPFRNSYYDGIATSRLFL
ncbi:MAG: hypothetical protein RSC41_04120 [Oscillospiraceae bacterium]